MLHIEPETYEQAAREAKTLECGGRIDIEDGMHLEAWMPYEPQGDYLYEVRIIWSDGRIKETWNATESAFDADFIEHVHREGTRW